MCGVRMPITGAVFSFLQRISRYFIAGIGFIAGVAGKRLPERLFGAPLPAKPSQRDSCGTSKLVYFILQPPLLLQACPEYKHIFVVIATTIAGDNNSAVTAHVVTHDSFTSHTGGERLARCR